jgi:predicted nucleic acid-binding protein
MIFGSDIRAKGSAIRLAVMRSPASSEAPSRQWLKRGRKLRSSRCSSTRTGAILIELAAKYRLAYMSDSREVTAAGGLVSMAANLPGHYERTAFNVDKILKGAKPADLSVQKCAGSRTSMGLRLRQSRGGGVEFSPRAAQRSHRERRRANEDKIALFVASGGIALLAFAEADAREAADIRGYLRRHATPIGSYDVLIAGQARRAGTPLVTANGREFARVPGLVVTDWAA